MTHNTTTHCRLSSFIATRRKTLRIVVVTSVVGVAVVSQLGGRPQGPIAPADDATIKAYIAHQLADSGIPGGAIAIVRNGQVSSIQGFGVADANGRPVTAQTPFVLGSISKSFTALAVMQLVDAGRIDLDRPVVDYLPAFRLDDPSGTSTVTVRQLLNQTSGIPSAAGQAPLSQPVSTLEEQVAALASVRPSTEPGAAYAYSNANYEVLGLLVERVSGQPFGQYVDQHIFGPLQMSHAHADLAGAEADGLTQAHRLWFGLSHDSAPLWRPDFLPAGWLTASAQDMAHYLVAQLDGGSYQGAQVASPAAISLMQTGTVAMGPLETGRYGFGWVDTNLGGVRVVGHTGSTTDMASAAFFAPNRGLGLVLLLNGQSTLYELLHKPDSIAESAFQQMLGQAPQGTLELFYPVFDTFVIALFGTIWYRLIRLIRRSRNGQSVAPRLFGRAALGLAFAVWLNAVVPIAILVNGPRLLGAPWTVLVRIDVGLVLFLFAVTRLATGLAILVGSGWLRRDVRSLGFVR
jgi:CubicO group peptidase (beta-lactamase class C family)